MWFQQPTNSSYEYQHWPAWSSGQELLVETVSIKPEEEWREEGIAQLLHIFSSILSQRISPLCSKSPFFYRSPSDLLCINNSSGVFGGFLKLLFDCPSNLLNTIVRRILRHLLAIFRRMTHLCTTRTIRRKIFIGYPLPKPLRTSCTNSNSRWQRFHKINLNTNACNTRVTQIRRRLINLQGLSHKATNRKRELLLMD